MKENHHPFETTYPNIARWAKSDGWIEMGQDSWIPSFVRALDEGGMVWEGKPEYGTLDKALQALDKGLAKFMQAQGLLGIELVGDVKMIFPCIKVRIEYNLA